MEISVFVGEDNIIKGYATTGGIEGGISIRADYLSLEEVSLLSIGYYKLIDGQIVVDEELQAQTETTQ